MSSLGSRVRKLEATHGKSGDPFIVVVSGECPVGEAIDAHLKQHPEDRNRPCHLIRLVWVAGQ